MYTETVAGAAGGGSRTAAAVVRLLMSPTRHITKAGATSAAQDLSYKGTTATAAEAKACVMWMP